MSSLDILIVQASIGLGPGIFLVNTPPTSFDAGAVKVTHWETALEICRA